MTDKIKNQSQETKSEKSVLPTGETCRMSRTDSSPDIKIQQKIEEEYMKLREMVPDGYVLSRDFRNVLLLEIQTEKAKLQSLKEGIKLGEEKARNEILEKIDSFDFDGFVDEVAQEGLKFLIKQSIKGDDDLPVTNCPLKQQNQDSAPINPHESRVTQTEDMGGLRSEDFVQKIIDEVYDLAMDEFYSTEIEFSTNILIKHIKDKNRDQHVYWYNGDIVDKMIKKAISRTIQMCEEKHSKSKLLGLKFAFNQDYEQAKKETEDKFEKIKELLVEWHCTGVPLNYNDIIDKIQRGKE